MKIVEFGEMDNGHRGYRDSRTTRTGIWSLQELWDVPERFMYVRFVRDVPISILSEITVMNAQKFFSISLAHRGDFCLHRETKMFQALSQLNSKHQFGNH